MAAAPAVFGQLPALTVQGAAKRVLTTCSPGAEGIRYGYEGGTAVKVDGVYHIFTSEIVGDPFWVNMRLGHWVSRDGWRWKRLSTLRQSSGDFTGRDPRAAPWAPMAIWDPQDQRWNIFYVGYAAEPDQGLQFRRNERGRIYRERSTAPGWKGIDGPYEDLGVIMVPEDHPDPWEGLQGVDSFYAWQVDGAWRAFYGSEHSENRNIAKGMVGFAAAKTLAGPWKRLSRLNPARIDDVFFENPVVMKLPKSGWLCIYDNERPDAIGWCYSNNGLDWSTGQSLIIQTKPGAWAEHVRTPLGLIPEGGGRCTLFYSGFEPGSHPAKDFSGEQHYRCAIGRVEIDLSSP